MFVDRITMYIFQDAYILFKKKICTCVKKIVLSPLAGI